jgi:hypothetical protein
MMTAMEAPIPAEPLTIVPANEASWDDLVAIFGTTDYPGRCPVSGRSVAPPSGEWSCGSTSGKQGTVVEAGQHVPGEQVSFRGVRITGQDEGLDAEVRVVADLG